MSPSEAEYLATHGPAKHARTAALIDDLCSLTSLCPDRLCHCDVGGACDMHQAAHRIIQRAHESGRPERARPAIQRFARRLGT